MGEVEVSARDGTIGVFEKVSVDMWIIAIE